MKRLGIVLFLAAVVVNEVKAQNFNISQVTYLVTGGIFQTSVVISNPSCQYYGKSVTVNINSTADPGISPQTFVAPPCRFKRNLIQADSGNGYTIKDTLGYKVTGLKGNTVYTIQYLIGNAASNSLTLLTQAPRNYTEIDAGLGSRSGAMVVITVLLSIAMFLLIIGLIAVIVMGSQK